MTNSAKILQSYNSNNPSLLKIAVENKYFYTNTERKKSNSEIWTDDTIKMQKNTHTNE